MKDVALRRSAFIDRLCEELPYKLPVNNIWGVRCSQASDSLHAHSLHVKENEEVPWTEVTTCRKPHQSPINSGTFRSSQTLRTTQNGGINLTDNCSLTKKC